MANDINFPASIPLTAVPLTSPSDSLTYRDIFNLINTIKIILNYLTGEIDLMAGIPDVPQGGLTYLRKFGAWVEASGGGGLEDLFPGNGIAVDKTDPKNPIVSSTLGSIHVDGRVANYSGLPSPPPSGGTTYYVESDGLIYIWDGAGYPSEGNGVRLTSLSISTDIYKAGTIQVPAFATGLLKTQGADGKRYLVPAFEVRADSVYEALVKSDNPYAFYPLDDAITGSTRDISSMYRNGSYKGSPSGTSQFVTGGTAAGCVALNGSSQYIDASPAAGATTDNYSIEMWIKCGASGNFSNWFDANQNSSGGNIIYCSATGVSFYVVPNTSKGSLSFSETLAANGIYHIVITANKSTNTFTLYLNGTQRDQKVISGTTWLSSSAQLLIGHDMYQGTHYGYFSGAISCAAFYDRVLTPTEVSAHYNSGKTP